MNPAFPVYWQSVDGLPELIDEAETKREARRLVGKYSQEFKTGRVWFVEADLS